MQSLRNFFITFFISLVVFGLLAWFLWGKMGLGGNAPVSNPENEITKPVDVKTQDTFENAQKPEEKGEGFTSLLCCYDDTTSRIDAAVLVNVNSAKQKFMLCPLPAYMKIDLGTDKVKKEVYLGDIITEKGKEFFIDKVEAITGLDVDYHAFLSSREFVKIVNEIGGVEFNVPEKMYYKDADGKVLVDLKPGKSKLNGDQALQLVRYRGYTASDDGDTKRRQIQCQFLTEVFNTFLKEENRDSIEGVVKNLLSLIKNGSTDFTLTAFIRYKDIILNYEKYGYEIILYPTVMTKSEELYEGENVTVYTPDIKEAIENTFSKYRTVRN